MSGPGGGRGGRPLGGSQQPAFRLWQFARLTEDWTQLAREILDGHSGQPATSLPECNQVFWDRLRKTLQPMALFQKKCEELRESTRSGHRDGSKGQGGEGSRIWDRRRHLTELPWPLAAEEERGLVS